MQNNLLISKKYLIFASVNTHQNLVFFLELGIAVETSVRVSPFCVSSIICVNDCFYTIILT